jgi:tetratricopeptide (TPR) repeat protein
LEKGDGKLLKHEKSAINRPAGRRRTAIAAVLAFLSCGLLVNVARADNSLNCTLQQDGGTPAAKLDVTLTNKTSNKQWKKKTNDKGEVEFKGLPDGSYKLEGVVQGSLLTNADGIELSGNASKTCSPVFVSVDKLNALLTDSMAAVQANKLDVAVEKGKAAVAMAPSVAEAHNALAIAYAYQGNEPDATAEVKKAAELNPTKFQPMVSKIQVSALDVQARQLEQKKDLDGMMKIYTRMLDITDQSQKATVYFNMAAAYGRFNKLEDALKYIDMAIKLDPADAEFQQTKVRLQDLYLKSTEKGLEVK